jgi:hypothetical protein
LQDYFGLHKRGRRRRAVGDSGEAIGAKDGPATLVFGFAGIATLLNVAVGEALTNKIKQVA